MRATALTSALVARWIRGQRNGEPSAPDAGELLVLGSSDLFGLGDCRAEGDDRGDGVRSEAVHSVVTPDGWRIERSLGLAVVHEERVFGIRDIALGSWCPWVRRWWAVVQARLVSGLADRNTIASRIGDGGIGDVTGSFANDDDEVGVQSGEQGLEASPLKDGCFNILLGGLVSE